MIRSATLGDACAIADIYNYYVENTVITFEEQSITVEEMASRMKSKIAQNRWFVYEEKGIVVGYAYAGPFAEHSAWRYTLELSVYIDQSFTGKGIGTKLYRHLLMILTEQDVHAVIASLTITNEPSVRMHEKLGFIKVAHLKEVGYKQNRWIDVGYWQYTFKD